MDNIKRTLEEAPHREADPYAPDYEGHYQKLLTALRWRAAAREPSIWGLIVDAGKSLGAMEQLRQYCEDVAILSTQLVYFDLRGIEPRLARLILLSRLLTDSAPISHLQDELRVAIADVIESRSTSDETAAATAPVILFAARMQVEPLTNSSELRAAEEDTSMSGFDSNKWSRAMAQQLWGIA